MEFKQRLEKDSKMQNKIDGWDQDQRIKAEREVETRGQNSNFSLVALSVRMNQFREGTGFPLRSSIGQTP